MTPSLPTFSIASAIILPMVVVAVGGDGADLGDLLLVLGRLRQLLQLLDDRASTALSMPRLSSIGLWPAATSLRALAEDRLREHGRGGGAVAGDVGGLGGDLLHHLRAHVLELVLELDLLGDGDAVLGDRGSAEGLLDDDVAALGPERDLHRVGERVDAREDRVARASRRKRISLAAMFVFSCLSGYFSMTPRMSSSRRMRCSSPSSLTSVPAYLPKRTRSPSLTSSGRTLPSSSDLAVADGDDLALERLLLGGVGDDDPALGLLFLGDALDDDAVLQRTNLHHCSSGWRTLLLSFVSTRSK